MTVSQLLASADSRELQEWIVFLEAEGERIERARLGAEDAQAVGG